MKIEREKLNRLDEFYIIVKEYKTNDGTDWCKVDFLKFADPYDWKKIWIKMKEVLSDDLQGAGGTAVNVKSNRMTAFNMLIGHYDIWFK